MIVASTLPSPEDLSLVQKSVSESKSSFYWAMRVLPKARREAMFAIYALCRELDDIADGEDGVVEKLEKLSFWERELINLSNEKPTHSITRALLPAFKRFDLDLAEFHELIKGMEMDAKGFMCAPSHSDLMLYCRRAAGTVGLLSISVFGRNDEQARQFALSLADALQLTNILRDLQEDARRNRLYLPIELLAKYGIKTTTPEQVLAHAALTDVCTELAKEARQKFNDAERAIQNGSAKGLKTALSMMAVYRRILAKLEQRGWDKPHGRLKLGKFEKLWLTLKPLAGGSFQ